MFTLSVEWRMGWERSLITELPNQERSLRPPPTLIKPHVFKEMRAIKATSLQRKVTKPLKSWEKRQEDKSRGCGEGGAVGAKSLVTGGDREPNRDSGPPRSDSTCTQMQSVGSLRTTMCRSARGTYLPLGTG